MPSIRINAYKSLNNLVKFRDGADAVYQNGVLEILVDKLLEEKEESVLVLVLLLLKAILGVEDATLKGLETPIIGRLTQLLTSSNAKVINISSFELIGFFRLENIQASI